MSLRILPVFRLVTGPTGEPVTLTEAKAHIREYATGQDALITSLITAARSIGEEQTRRAWMRQTWDMQMDRFPWSYGVDYDQYARDSQRYWGQPPILVPKPPLQSVTSITYVNSTGGNTTLSATAYRVDTMSEPARITPVYGAFWPIARQVASAVTVRFVAGYVTGSGATAGKASAVPQLLKQACLLTVGSWYENRESVVEDYRAVAIEVPQTVKMIYSTMNTFRFE